MTNKKKNRSGEDVRQRLLKKLETTNERNETDKPSTDQMDLLKQQIGNGESSEGNKPSVINMVNQEVESQKPYLFVCTPCYNGTVHVKYMQSVMNLQLFCIQNGIRFQFYTVPFDSLIPRARNACVTRFMQDKSFTHLLFIDADIEFDPRSVGKMLNENKDVIGGIYSKKALDFKSLYENFNDIKNEMELVQSAGRYAFNFKHKMKHEIRNGVVEVLDAPTGFLMIKKRVFEIMIEKHPELEYINDVQPYNVTPEDKFYDLFPSQIFKEENGKNRYLSEDYGFCRLWQKLGGQIFADLTVSLNHIGQFAYCGNPLVYLHHKKDITIEKST